MPTFRKTLLAAAAVYIIGSVPAFAEQPTCPGKSCAAPGHNKNVGAPGPIAGAGLPFLLVAGGYMLVRRYRKRNADLA